MKITTPFGDIPIVASEIIPPGVIVVTPPHPIPPLAPYADAQTWLDYRDAHNDWQQRTMVITGVGYALETA